MPSDVRRSGQIERKSPPIKTNPTDRKLTQSVQNAPGASIKLASWFKAVGMSGEGG